jgi:D-alanyl-D-alanine carboxypeptidase (penicillin-binding protein 5/6)
MIKKKLKRWHIFLSIVLDSTRFSFAFGALFLFCLFLASFTLSQGSRYSCKSKLVKKLPFEQNTINKALASNDQEQPFISAGGIYLVDLTSHTMLWQKNADQHFYPASTTKIVSSMVALSAFGNKQVINVPYVPKEGQVLGLQSGEQYYFEDLLYGLLVQSGNDVAEVLAYNYPGGYDKFIAQMNQTVVNLKLKDSKFRNPSGIDQYEHFSSPHDLALISAKALDNTDFAKIVSTKSYNISDLSEKRQIQLENVNKLLGEIEGLKGVKTGWTQLAGECLVSYLEKDDRQILSVVLQSQDRFTDTKRILAWALDNFSWQDL